MIALVLVHTGNDMTEAIWLSSNELRLFLDYLYEKCTPNNRKLRLLCCGFCRRQQRHLRAAGILELLNQMESFVDNEDGLVELRAKLIDARSQPNSNWLYGYDRDNPIDALRYAAFELACWCLIEPTRTSEPFYSWENQDWMPNGWEQSSQFPFPHQIARIIADAYDSDIESGEGWSFEREQQLLLVRDIFGNPFRPIAFDPRWRTSSVLDLAQGIYDERAFERMPILADALMDASCDSEDIIQHCRGEGPHVRGCWVVDLILGKS